MSESQANAAMASIDDLLDGTLDDLSDIPAFKPFPTGAYRLTLNFEAKMVGAIPSVEIKLTVVEPMELTDAAAEPPKAGDTTNILCMLKKKDGTKNEIGEGQLKGILAKLAPAFPEAKSNRTLMEAANGFEVLGVTGQRADKTDKTKVYTTLENVELL